MKRLGKNFRDMLVAAEHSKNPYIRTFNFGSQAAIGSCLMITYSNIKLSGSCLGS